MRKMNVTVSPSLSSFSPTTDEYQREYAGASIERTQEVTVTTLDQILDDLPYKRLFLKSETQGYDLRVLRGGRRMLASRVVGVQIELAALHIYEDAPDYVEALAEMRGYGFLPSGFFALETTGLGDPELRLGSSTASLFGRDPAPPA